jgi:hypothetical protein
MKILDTKAGMVLALGVVGVASLYLFKKSIADGAAAAAQSINPVNDENIFNQGVLAVGQKITGNENWTLGGAIYDLFNGSPEEQAQRAAEKAQVDVWAGNPNR